MDNAVVSQCAKSQALLGDYSAGTSTDSYFGPVVIRQYNNSTAFPMVAAGGTTIINSDISFFDGRSRLIGMGVEVYDVTAEIYRQGTLTVVQLPAIAREDQVLFKLGQTVDGLVHTETPVTARQFTPQPATLADAMSYQGARQWEAADGCYVVVPFTSEPNVARIPEYCSPYCFTSNYNEDSLQGSYLTIVNADPVYMDKYLTTVTNTCFQWPCHKWTPTHQKVIYLTGLNANSTFTINTMMYIETFPTLAQLDILTLARPSCAYDPLALAIISEATKLLPIAVKVADNADGDWFWDLVETIAPIVGPALGGFLGGPGGALLGGSLGAGIAQVAGRQKKPKPKKNTPVTPSNNPRSTQSPAQVTIVKKPSGPPPKPPPKPKSLQRPKVIIRA